MGGASQRRSEIERGLRSVRARVEQACADVGRDPGELTLVVVTKFFPASDVQHLLDLGVRDIGENKDQEAGAKVAELATATRERLTVHFVGQLQTNKANRVTRYADVVQSVDRDRLVRALQNGRANAVEQGHADGPLDVFLQVDLAEGERAGRGGAAPGQLSALADMVGEADQLRLRGLMAVAPYGADATRTRASFEHLAALADALRATHPEADAVSAGMSGDLEIAIAAGATHLRVGSAILGSRPHDR